MKKHIAFSFILMLQIVFAYKFLFEKELGWIINNKLAEEPVGEITVNEKIVQEVYLEGYVNEIALKLATYARENNAHLTVIVTYQDELLNKVTLSSKDIVDNAFYFLEINKDISSEKALKIELATTNGQLGNAFTVWKSKHDNYNGDLYRNGSVTDGDLTLQATKEIYKYERIYEMLNNLPISPNKVLFIICLMILSINMFLYSYIINPYIKV